LTLVHVGGGGVGAAHNFHAARRAAPAPATRRGDVDPAGLGRLQNREARRGPERPAHRGIARIGEDGQEDSHGGRFYPGPLPARATGGYSPRMDDSTLNQRLASLEARLARVETL